jgi:hypothetical protein
MSEAEAMSPWAAEVKETVAQRAYTLNYEDGVQCRVLPLQSENGRYAWEISLETTHAGQPFDLTWIVRWTDSESNGIELELIAPASEGGTLWHEAFVSVPHFSAAADVVPVFIRGYFVGREAALTQPVEGDRS